MQDQTWDDLLEDIVVQMKTRQAQVQSIIQKYVSRYASLNIPLGKPGTFIPVPGANIVTLAATIVALGSEMFQPMEEDIVQVYQASPTPFLASSTQENAPADASSLNTASPVNDFTREFLHTFITRALISQISKRVMMHYLPALALETLIDWLPMPGGVLSASIHTSSEVILIRRIGVLLASYFENGQQWIGNSPARTNAILCNYGGGYASMDDIPSIPEVREGIITRLLAQSRTVYEKAGVDTYKEVHQLLAKILRLKFSRAGAAGTDHH